LSDQIGDDLMPGGVPMSISNISIESVKKNSVLVGVRLHRFGQIKKIDMFALSQGL